MNRIDVGPCSLLSGDCLTVLRSLPDESVQCCVTSPPYFGLRDYGLRPSVWGGAADCQHSWADHVQPAANGLINNAMQGETLSGRSATRRPKRSAFCSQCGAWRGCLGLEPTPGLFVAHLVEIFREVRRVLHRCGTLWLNLGDSYANCPGNGRGGERKGLSKGGAQPHRSGIDKRGTGVKTKDLLGIPWRAAFALQEAGWYLRADIIWAKPNPMPESVRDRPTKAHEYLFLLSKSPRYHYDGRAIKEPCVSGPSDVRKMREKKDRIGGKHKTLNDPRARASATTNLGRKRSVGSPDGRNRRSVWTVATAPFRGAHFATFPPALIEPCILAGCPEGGTVLDPFGGAMTAGLVAARLGRRFIGIELNPEYLAMGADRLRRAA